MAKEYFETHGEYKEFDSETKKITAIGDFGPDRFYYSVSKLESDIHFDGALFHEKLNVKRTLDVENNSQILTATNENGVITQNSVFQNIPKTNVVGENAFESVKASVLNKIANL